MTNNKFKLKSKFTPNGDQPSAIRKLVSGLNKGYKHQTLLGVTGSGKTFTIANVIEKVQKPTLVIAHNKTLAAQLCNEFRELFPDNSVHYFVSYYDYYQPEAYMPTTDTYIDKEALINDEIDKLRHAATSALLTREDVIVVASVSCIYGLGAPEAYKAHILEFSVGDKLDRQKLMRTLIEMQFKRTNSDLKRGTFRLRGDNWEIMPPYEETIYNFVIENDKIHKIYVIDPVKGFQKGKTPSVQSMFVSPARHFLTLGPDRDEALIKIKKELKEQLKKFEKEKKYLEAERLERRTKADIAMIREVGYCNGIENYSRHLSGREAGEPPATLLEYFPHSTSSGQAHSTSSPRHGSGQAGQAHSTSSPRHGSGQAGQADFLVVIDESHATVPQLNGMYHADAARKKTLIEYGFRLPSAIDNRPLKFEEFEKRAKQVIYTSATPAVYEKKKSRPTSTRDGKLRRGGQIVEQVIRPTGLVDPKIIIRPAREQVDDLIPEVEKRVKANERVLITTLTKRMAEDLSEYLHDREIRSGTSSESQLNSERSRTTEGTLRQAQGGGKQNKDKLKVAYLHSDVKTLERVKILTALRRGDFDVLVGVNLLREGLDLPEVTLVAILDADKEGFLRSETSLIQTIGRAARNVKGEVLMYADNITGSIERAVGETNRRRALQLAYNKKNNIKPKTIVREITDIVPVEDILALETRPLPRSKKELDRMIKTKEHEMKEAAGKLEFELASILRDEIMLLKSRGKKKKRSRM